MAATNMGNGHGANIFYHPSTNRSAMVNATMKVQSALLRKNTPRTSLTNPLSNSIPNPGLFK